MLRKKRGQGAVEFIGLISIMFLMFVLFFSLVNDKVVDFQTDKNYRQLQMVGELVRKEIELAAKAEPGYIRTFELPPTLIGKHYSVAIQKGPYGTNAVIRYENFSLKDPYVVKIQKDVYFKENITAGRNMISKNLTAIAINDKQPNVFDRLQRDFRDEFKVVLPECSDGKDNDNDRLIDYDGLGSDEKIDDDCVDAEDELEGTEEPAP